MTCNAFICGPFRECEICIDALKINCCRQKRYFKFGNRIMNDFAIKTLDPFESWWPFIIAVVVGILMAIRAIMGGQVCPSNNMINNLLVIVTGSSSGIGLEICKNLCKRNAKIIMACKNLEKANEAIIDIKKKHSNAQIEVRHLDLNSFDCVRRFVKSINDDFEKIDILINNAGIIFNKKDKTVDGFETHLQVNYLSHFLLTSSLMPLLQNAEQGRIINVAAHAYCSGRMDIDDPLNIGVWATSWHQRDAFAHSKLAIILATRHMAKVTKESSVTVNVCTPGLVRGTDHLRRSPVMNSICAKIVTYPWMWLFMKTPEQGSQTIMYLAIEPKLKTISGEYFNDCEQAQLTELALDDQLAESLFRHTLTALKLNKF